MQREFSGISHGHAGPASERFPRFQELRVQPNGGDRLESEIRSGERKRAAIGCVDVVKKAVDENKIVGTGRNGLRCGDIRDQKIAVMSVSR
jgi:hypothetical protein